MRRLLTLTCAFSLASALAAFAGLELAACSSAEPVAPGSAAADGAPGSPSGSNLSNATPNAEDASGGDGAADASAPLPPCTVKLPTACPTPPTTYQDILPVLTSRCLTCHSGTDQNGPWPLTDYSHVADWQDAVRAEVAQCTMPPSDAGFVMTDAERLVLLNWVRCGAPE